MSVFRPAAHALITGGASGVGLAVARLCLQHAMKVTIVDNNTASLSLAAESLKDVKSTRTSQTNLSATDADISTLQADVTKKDDWARIHSSVGTVDFLMLNAGIGERGTWGDGSGYAERVFGVNLFGVVNGLDEFVPQFIASDSADGSGKDGKEKRKAIVITGSKQGITNPPGNAVYNASKAAVKSLAEHLSFEMRETGVGVHLLVPGWTFTGLSGNAPGSTKPKPDGAWSADQVAEYMYKKMQDDKFYIICPDNDVSEETDKKRMLWSVGDIVNERPPLTRWRPEFKDEAAEWMEKCKV